MEFSKDRVWFLGPISQKRDLEEVKIKAISSLHLLFFSVNICPVLFITQCCLTGVRAGVLSFPFPHINKAERLIFTILQSHISQISTNPNVTQNNISVVDLL